MLCYVTSALDQIKNLHILQARTIKQKTYLSLILSFLPILNAFVHYFSPGLNKKHLYARQGPSNRLLASHIVICTSINAVIYTLAQDQKKHTPNQNHQMWSMLSCHHLYQCKWFQTNPLDDSIPLPLYSKLHPTYSVLTPYTTKCLLSGG